MPLRAAEIAFGLLIRSIATAVSTPLLPSENSAYRPAVPHARWLLAVLCYTVTPLALLFLPGHARAIDPAWDFGMALGVISVGGVALLPLLSARWWGVEFPALPFLRLLHDVHLGLAYVLTAFALLHVTVLCVLEPRVLAYLTLAAPWSMLAGLAAAVLLLFLCLSSRWRVRLGWRQTSWRRWHALLSALALSGMAWHILDARYYFNRGSILASLLWMLAVPTLLSLWLRKHPVQPAGGRRMPRWVGRMGALRVVALITFVWVLLGAVWIGVGNTAPPPSATSPCASNPCL